ncbi:MAG: hypothetical protein O7G30_02755 [Proteobacteria bacterium]|nr:hypothetical protein [Pseudomonadota bacterium]
MSSSDSADLPDVAQVLGDLIASVPPEQRPIFLTIAERMAAERYRGWAADASDEADREQLLACATREEEIAERVEAIFPNAEAIARDIHAKHPELPELNRSVFAGRPIEDQYTIQARGERVGAATWTSFAKQTESAEAREVFHACVGLEEESARALEGLLGRSV